MEEVWSRRIKWRWQMKREMRKRIPEKATNIMDHLRGSMKAYYSGNFLNMYTYGYDLNEITK